MKELGAKYGGKPAVILESGEKVKKGVRRGHGFFWRPTKLCVGQTKKGIGDSVQWEGPRDVVT